MTPPAPAPTPAPFDARPWPVYRRLLGYARPHRAWFLLALAGMAGYAWTQVTLISMTRPLIDGTFLGRDHRVAASLPLAIVGLFLLRGLTQFMSGYGMAWVAQSVVVDIRRQLFAHIQRLPTRFFEKMGVPHLMARMTYHTGQVADAVTSALTSMVQDGLQVVGFLGYMLYLDWRLTLFTLVVGPFIAVIIGYVSRRFRSVSRRIQDQAGLFNQALDEAIGGQRVVKIHNAQGFEQKRFERLNRANRWLNMKVVVTGSSSQAMVQVMAAVAVASIVYFATRPERLATLSPGSFVAFMGAMMSLLGPIKSLTQVNERLQRGIAAAGEIFGLLADPAEPDDGTREITGRAEGRLRFEGVRHRYQAEAPEALAGVTLEVSPGTTVAFVGRSGSGKTTLLSLLPRFYDPTAGRILLDGHDLRDYRLDSLRRQIGVVDQQVRLFDASVFDNIAYGLDPPPPRERVEAAARDAGAWEFIERLPGGLDTPVGPNGALLSGGQRQRLAIARTLLKDAPILILDEATSALDTESERLVQAALERLRRGRTTLVIAHRLSTVQSADRIVVMDQGRIVEQGTHTELLAADGAYARLYRLQFAEEELGQRPAAPPSGPVSAAGGAPSATGPGAVAAGLAALVEAVPGARSSLAGPPATGS